jgi:RecA-family ATPase
VPALLVLLTALLTLIVNTFLEHVRSQDAFTTEIRKTQLTHIAEVWEKLYMLEACVEDLMFVRNASTEVGKEEAAKEFYSRIRARKQQSVENGKQLVVQLNEMIEKDRFWLGEGLYQRSEIYVIELEKMLYTEEIPNDLLQRFRRVQKKRRETLESVRRRLLAGRDPRGIVEFDESLVGALRAFKDLGGDAK